MRGRDLDAVLGALAEAQARGEYSNASVEHSVPSKNGAGAARSWRVALARGAAPVQRCALAYGAVSTSSSKPLVQPNAQAHLRAIK